MGVVSVLQELVLPCSLSSKSFDFGLLFVLAPKVRKEIFVLALGFYKFVHFGLSV